MFSHLSSKTILR